MIVRNFLTSAILLVFCSLSVAAEGPFGLSWGMSKSEVEGAGVTLGTKDNQGLDNITMYSTTSLPKNLSDAEEYTLIFESEFGLVKVLLVSETISGDVYGTEGKARYKELKGAFQRKYGNPSTELEHSGLKLWDENDEFYQCLAYDGCGYWLSAFEKEGVSYIIELKGLKRGEGYFVLTFEGSRWSEAIDKANKSNLQSDEDAI